MAMQVATVHPVQPTADELGHVVGREQYAALAQMLKLDGNLDYVIVTKGLTTYKPIGAASGWFWRDQKFHEALGIISKKSIAAGGAAKSAVVTRADNSGKPTRPGRAFYQMLEEARGIDLRDATGNFDETKCEAAWRHEMMLLGYDPSTL